MSRALVIALFAIGCGRQLNPEYCAMNPNDTDCRSHDLVMIDAPAGCPTIACMDQKLPVCEVSTGNCVECLPAGVMGSDPAQCPTDTTCGPDRKCHACLVDTDCKISKVCLSNGTCAPDGTILYAQPQPMSGADCSITKPCSFSDAVSMLSTTKNIVKLTTTAGTEYSDSPVQVTKAGTIIGTGATFTPTFEGDPSEAPPAISIDNATNVLIDGLTIASAPSVGVGCQTTTITLRRMTIVGSGKRAVQAVGCNATLERNTFMRNIGGAIYLSTGLFEIRNNMIGPGNGDANLATGEIWVDKAKVGGRAVFNTVARNNSQNGNKISGMNCTGSGMFKVAHNIFTSNGPGTAQTAGDCKYSSNFLDGTYNIDDVKFVNKDSDFHLTMMSPTSTVREDADADADCRLTPGGAYLDDFDGQLRPNGLCDRGADEWLP